MADAEAPILAPSIGQAHASFCAACSVHLACE